MQQPEDKRKEEVTFSQKVENFILKFKKQLLAGAGVIVAALIIFGIVTAVQSRRLEEYTIRTEQAQQLFQEYQEADEDQRPALAEELQSELDEIIDGINDYPALRALMISGELAYQQDRLEDAKDYFLTAAEQFSSSYLAPVAYMNAAVISEELEQLEQAIEYYQRIVDSYADEFQGVSRALLNIGRLHEAQNDTDGAVRAYQQLTSDFENTEWANLAQTRLLQIQIDM